ncbi:5'(3')-deoxyribonucleotidase [Mucilaginibacter sp. UYNi724]
MKLLPEDNAAISFQSDDLRISFIDHLNIVYCAKAHLIERLLLLDDNVDVLNVV